MSNALEVILQMGLFARIIIILLIILSFISWAIIFDKTIKNRKISRESRDFLNLFSSFRTYQDVIALSHDFRNSPYPRIIRNMQNYLENENPLLELEVTDNPIKGSFKQDIYTPFSTRINSYLEGTIIREISNLEKHLIILSTTVSISPFLGLLGTVWGIMSAFLSMGLKGSANIATIGPGIAEALITTIAGLAVAIPALIAYNFFVDRIRREEDRLSIFSKELIQIIERERK